MVIRKELGEDIRHTCIESPVYLPTRWRDQGKGVIVIDVKPSYRSGEGSAYFYLEINRYANLCDATLTSRLPRKTGEGKGQMASYFFLCDGKAFGL